MNAENTLLTIDGLSAGYKRTEVLHRVSLTVEPGEFVTVLGSNGAGKSTLMKVIAGIVKGTGSVRLRGVDLLALEPHQRVGHGVAYVPEGRRVFPALTVEENLRAASRLRGAAFGDAAEEIYDVFPRLKERRDQLAGTMSGGEQQMLAMGRALVSKPSLLLADEISLGLAPLVVEALFKVLAELNRSGMAVLLAEQNAHAALEYADRAYVLETGRITLEGTARELAADQRVIDAYLQLV
ncbi:MAG TPA: ABC transporter ATP-binding protein [Marmoricola sp.]|nr:ABC transporter ATP-binding protein [Marmoricola sp.]